MSNIQRCERCGSFLIDEQVRNHHCEIPLKGVRTIWLDWISDGFTDKNKDHVKSAKGLDGILYTLILCKHNPSHRTRVALAILFLALLAPHSFTALASPNAMLHAPKVHVPNVELTLPYVR